MNAARAIFAALFLLAGSAAATGGDLLGLDGAPLGAGLPAGWKVRPVSGYPAPEYSVREEAEGPVLHVEGMGAAAWAYRELEAPIPVGSGVLRWSWRVLELPAGTDLRVESKDDAALRLYVVFGEPGAFAAARNRVIFYTWGNTEPKGLALRSFASARFHIVRVAGALDVGSRWHDEQVEPFEDFRRFWSGDPPAITAVGLMQDTDMTGGKAVSEIRSLLWESR